MGRYAILDATNTVVNTAMAESPLSGDWIKLGENSPVVVGWTYQGGEFAEPAKPSLVYLSGLEVKVNGTPAQFFAGNYYADPKDTALLTVDMVDANGDVRTDISFPMTLKLPMVRHSDGKPTTDEVYMNFTVVAGKATATVEIERSGDWKILIGRLNVALGRMFDSTGAAVQLRFEVSAADITIIA